MRRLLALSLIGSAVAGCGPVAPTAPTTGPAAVTPSPTLSVGEARPTVAARKTWTRAELKAWLEPKELPGGKWEQRTPASVKAMFGPPDSSREVKRQNPGELAAAYLVFTYKGLTLDAKGSGKVDSECHVYFNNDTAVPKLVEFVP